jgi:hypothetical protein
VHKNAVKTSDKLAKLGVKKRVVLRGTTCTEVTPVTNLLDIAKSAIWYVKIVVLFEAQNCGILSTSKLYLGTK